MPTNADKMPPYSFLGFDKVHYNQSDGCKCTFRFSFDQFQKNLQTSFVRISRKLCLNIPAPQSFPCSKFFHPITFYEAYHKVTQTNDQQTIENFGNFGSYSTIFDYFCCRKMYLRDFIYQKTFLELSTHLR